ncbi:MAG: radical SAM protein [Firmicutes bacterium]|nr:radical SAM protein [Bacillota bacterium]
MSIIYQPTGMAREYSPYACNIYIGCSHRCKYCYAPHTLQRNENAYFGKPLPRKDVLRGIEKDLQVQKYDKQILLSFIGDVYCENADNSQTTRDALRLLNAYEAPVAVLTKGVSRALRDLDIFKAFGKRIMVGATLTFMDEEKSKEWESGADLPSQRLSGLKALHDAGIKTFASFEPSLDPIESLKLIHATLADNSVDHYKIGKVNNYKGMDKGVDWTSYIKEALSILREAGKQIYVKSGVRTLVTGIEYLPCEIDPDYYAVRV